MNIIKKVNKACVSCGKEHDVEIISENESITYKNAGVTYEAIYEYCSNTGAYLETEEMMKLNGIAIRDSYRAKMDLLTSRQIKDVRKKYKVNQKDFAKILGWGAATMARYESFFIQERSNDFVLRKIDTDPEWFLIMLENAKGQIGEKSYRKCMEATVLLVERKNNPYINESFVMNYIQVAATNSKINMKASNYMEQINNTACANGNGYILNPNYVPETYNFSA